MSERDDRDLGGESACWAHFADDLMDDRIVPPRVALGELVARDGHGAIWSLPHGGDLDANAVRLRSGEEIGEHVNDDVDVLVVVWSGDGRIEIDGTPTALSAGIVVSVERGRRRRITAGDSDLVYLSVHRRRDPLTIRAYPTS